MSILAALPSPSDLVEQPYMRTALTEVALLAIAGGLLGAWIVLRQLAFYAHSVGTVPFPGLVIADATGFSATVAALAVALAYAAGVERAGRSGRSPSETATALGLVLALALGVVLASDVFDSGSAVDRLLFGTAIGLGDTDVAVAGGAAVLAALATILLGRGWTAAAFDRAGSAAIGLPARALDLALLGLIAVAAVAALPAVGALLVASLFVVPAACARLLARGVPQLLVLSVAAALVQGVVGLYVSLWLDVAPGPAIAVTGTTLYAAVALARAVATTTPAPAPLEAT